MPPVLYARQRIMHVTPNEWMVFAVVWNETGGTYESGFKFPSQRQAREFCLIYQPPERENHAH